MDDREPLSERFQQHRPHLRAVAYRMLGSVAEADDALQEAWLRIRDQDTGSIENLRAWLTTVVGRVCLNVLRARRARSESLSGVHVPDPVVTRLLFLSDPALIGLAVPVQWSVWRFRSIVRRDARLRP